MRVACVAFLLLLLNTLGSPHQERDFNCHRADAHGAAASNRDICGPHNISAYAVDPFKAFLSWQPSKPVDSFRVTVFVDDGVEPLRVHTTRCFQGNNRVTSRHSVLIPNLEPWKYYVLNLGGCSEEYCCDAGNTTFSTPPDSVPAPLFTRVEGTGPNSIKVAWEFPQHDLRLFDGFRIVYGAENNASRFVVYTKKENLTLRSLTPETKFQFEVAAQYKDTDGRPVLGKKGTASVTTWTKLPVVDIEYETDVPDDIGTTLVTWRCVNSSVDYFQYRIKEYDEWKACNDSAECDFTFNDDRNETLRSGYLRLTHRRLQVELKPARVVFLRNEPRPGSIRGCNSNGCGRENYVTAYSLKKVPGPSSLSGVTVTPRGNTAVLRWNPPDQSGYKGVEVTWNCNGNNTATHLSSFHIDSSYDNQREILVDGLPFSAEHCEFYISAYRDGEQRTYYSLPVRATPE